MHDNLRQHRQQRTYTPQSNKPPSTSFNGPFFRLEQVSPAPQHYHYDQQSISVTHQSPISPYQSGGNETVVIWPPPSTSAQTEKSRPVTPKSILDPDRVGVFERQKQMELEAMRRNEENLQSSLEKQFYATQLQQQRIQSRAESHRYEPEMNHVEMMMSPPPQTSQSIPSYQTRLVQSFI
jgi:hypothetical protein